MDPQVSEDVFSVSDSAIPQTVAVGDSNSRTEETEATLMALAEAVEQRDPHTARHCERLAFTSVALGMALQVDRTSLMALYRGGFLHDIGKVGIPDQILFQQGRLTPEQWVIMRTHTIRGEQICRHVTGLKPVLPIIRHHHERWDGSGYPDGLRGPEIPLLARVLQVADIYDALTSPRPYKPAYSVKEALRIIESETELGYRDPEIIALFFRLHGSIISRIDQMRLSEDSRFDGLRRALSSLDEAVNSNGLDEIRPSGRISFLPPQSAPESDFPWAATDTSRTE